MSGLTTCAIGGLPRRLRPHGFAVGFECAHGAAAGAGQDQPHMGQIADINGMPMLNSSVVGPLRLGLRSNWLLALPMYESSFVLVLDGEPSIQEGGLDAGGLYLKGMSRYTSVRELDTLPDHGGAGVTHEEGARDSNALKDLTLRSCCVNRSRREVVRPIWTKGFNAISTRLALVNRDLMTKTASARLARPSVPE